MNSVIYSGVVAHRRYAPRVHALRYRLFMLLLDIDTLDQQRCAWFSYNRGNLLAFFDRDHGDRSGARLRPFLERKLAASCPAYDGGAIRVLCMPRMLGYVFNPLTVYFCARRDGELAAIIYEVANTFGEQHIYVLPVQGVASEQVRQRCEKAFFVSPFLHMGLTYEFNIAPPGESVTVAMRVCDGDKLMLTASFAGKGAPMAGASILKACLMHPLMTFGAMAAIHWEAIKLLAKGVPFLGRRGAARDMAPRGAVPSRAE